MSTKFEKMFASAPVSSADVKSGNGVLRSKVSTGSFATSETDTSKGFDIAVLTEEVMDKETINGVERPVKVYRKPAVAYLSADGTTPTTIDNSLDFIGGKPWQSNVKGYCGILYGRGPLMKAYYGQNSPQPVKDASERRNQQRERAIVDYALPEGLDPIVGLGRKFALSDIEIASRPTPDANGKVTVFGVSATVAKAGVGSILIFATPADVIKAITAWQATPAFSATNEAIIKRREARLAAAIAGADATVFDVKGWFAAQGIVVTDADVASLANFTESQLNDSLSKAGVAGVVGAYKAAPNAALIPSIVAAIAAA